MVTVDNSRCTGCGICLSFCGGYCIHDQDGGIVIDDSVCNDCQKCISICPQMAFSYDGVLPERIKEPLGIGPGDLMELLTRRRSVKHFADRKIPRDLLSDVAGAAQYAPTMNKAIELRIIDDAAILRRIDGAAIRRVTKMYRWLFRFRIITGFVSLFADTMPVIKRKMERDLYERQGIMKDHTQALILVTGSTKMPVTESSGQYYLANMILYAETAGLGSTLMDSLKITLNKDRSLRQWLGIPAGQTVLGVLALGYPAEKIINIPKGYEIDIRWNKDSG